MLRAGFKRCREGQQGVGRQHATGQPLEIGHLRLAAGEGAGLVEHDGAQLAGRFQGFGAAEDQAVLCPLAGGHHDRSGGGQAQGTRAGDHQHTHQKQHRQHGIAADQEPDHEGGDGQGDHHRHEPAHHLIGQALHLGAGALGLAHQLHDLGQHRVGPHPADSEGETAAAVHRGADHGIAGSLGHGRGFTGEHRLLHPGTAFAHLPIHRDLFAGPHLHQVTDHHHRHRNFNRLSIPQHPGAGGLQLQQPPDRF